MPDTRLGPKRNLDRIHTHTHLLLHKLCCASPVFVCSQTFRGCLPYESHCSPLLWRSAPPHCSRLRAQWVCTKNRKRIEKKPRCNIAARAQSDSIWSPYSLGFTLSPCVFDALSVACAVCPVHGWQWPNPVAKRTAAPRLRRTRSICASPPSSPIHRPCPDLPASLASRYVTGLT